MGETGGHPWEPLVGHVHTGVVALALEHGQRQQLEDRIDAIRGVDTTAELVGVEVDPVTGEGGVVVRDMAGEFTDPVSGDVLIATGGALESQAIGPILSSVEMACDSRTWDDKDLIVHKLD